MRVSPSAAARLWVLVPKPWRVERRAARRLRVNQIRSGSTSWSWAACDISTRMA